MRSSILALLLVLSSCAAPALRWNFVAAAELRELAVRAGLPPTVRAFALKTPAGCTIYSTTPESREELLEIWLHEKRHCDEGAWH